VSGILQRAHETAAQITAQSRSEADDRLVAARQEAADIVQDAADRVKELDLETDRIWEERLRIVEDARELARQLLTLADSAAQRFPAEETESTEAVAQPEIAEIFNVAEPVAPPELDGAHEQTEAAVEPLEERAEPAEDAEELDERELDERELDEPELDEPELDDREATAIMPPVKPREEDDQPR
jgi:septum site-determining protein MinD